ncbi:hypothetical protein [Psychromonas sp. L1A2]|uniref:hypothetical protein n=1 Tax=Psychromonas sp. L1A2 TaxID=2686356 RepID=UPI00135B5C1B|nr:hypothetical protein [Psychromonas sp. L1A2]
MNLENKNLKILVNNKYALAFFNYISNKNLEGPVSLNLFNYESSSNIILDEIIDSNMRTFILNSRDVIFESLGHNTFYVGNGLSLEKSLVIGSSILYLGSYKNKTVGVIFGSGFNRLIGILLYSNSEFTLYLDKNDFTNTALNRNITADFYNNVELSMPMSSIITYLRGNKKSAQSLLLHHWHLGHHLWNEVSVLQEVQDMGKWHDNWSLIKSCPTSEHFGLTRDLFESKGTSELTLNQNENINEVIINKNLCVYIPMSRHIKEKTSIKILEHAKQYTSVLSQLLPKNKDHIKILFNIRLGDRELLNQMDLIESLSNKLTSINKNHTIFIDGINNNRGARGESVANKTALEDEFAFSDKLLTLLPDTCVSMIGCSVYESIYVCSISDLYIAPWGAGLAKYAWVCNAKGFIHCSNYVKEKKNDLAIYDDPRFRENIRSIDFLKEITDEKSEHIDEFRRNYSINIENAVNELIQHLIS